MTKKQVIKVVYQIEDEAGTVVAESMVRGAYMLDAKYDASPTVNFAAGMIEAQAQGYMDSTVLLVQELTRVVGDLDVAVGQLEHAMAAYKGAGA